MRDTTTRTMKIRSSTIYKVCILFLLITSGVSCKEDAKTAEAEMIVALLILQYGTFINKPLWERMI